MLKYQFLWLQLQTLFYKNIHTLVISVSVFKLEPLVSIGDALVCTQNLLTARCSKMTLRFNIFDSIVNIRLKDIYSFCDLLRNFVHFCVLNGTFLKIINKTVQNIENKSLHATWNIQYHINQVLCFYVHLTKIK